MIDITSILNVERVVCRHETSSKKKMLETMSELLAKSIPSDSKQSDPSQLVFDALLKRERLGSTGLGHGIALPHGRIESLRAPLAAVATLQTPVDFDALDGQPVGIVFALAMPEDCNEQHLQILARLAEMFSDPMLCNALRNAKSAEEIHQRLSGWQPHAESA